jgi:hypothetical protein
MILAMPARPMLSSARRSAHSRKTKHMRADHPYEPFPVAEVEAAVDAAVFEGSETPLRFFGESHRFRQAARARLAHGVPWWLFLKKAGSVYPPN